MKRAAVILLACLLLSLPAFAREKRKPKPTPKNTVDEAAVKFLAEYAKARYNPVAKGLKSIGAEILLTQPDKKLSVGKLKIAYAWCAPSDESVHIEEKSPLKKLFSEYFKDLWKVLSSDFVSAAVAKYPPKFNQEAENVRLDLYKGKRIVTSLFFDKNRRLIRRQDGTGRKTTETYQYIKVKEAWLLSSKTTEYERKGEVHRMTVKFTRHREVNTYHLPALVTVARPKGDITLDIKYLTINGVPALVAGVDVKDLKAKIREFEKGWRKWDALEKVAQVKKLAEEGGPHVAAVLAKCLKDREVMVRLEIAKTLGQLGEKTAVSALCSALDANRKYIDVFKEVARALGRISDPKAVKYLAKNIMGGKRGDGTFRQQAMVRIEAIGNIKHVIAVDELIDLFGKAGGGRRGGGHGYGVYRATISKALRKLTGMDFRGQNEWRSWWSKNKRSFRFE